MIRCALVSFLAFALVVSVACKRVEQRVAEFHVPDEPSVTIDLEPLQSDSQSQRWMGAYVSGGKVARFRIELGPAKAAPAQITSEFTFKFGEGRLLPERGSDSIVLLADLQKALQAKTLPSTPPQKKTVPFPYANLGDNLSQAGGGGLTQDPPGHWTALKLFFGEGDQESQVFLNINSSIRKAQFAIKDPDYGNLAMAEFAKVL